MKKLFTTLFLAVLFVGCNTPHFSENSPIYYDENTKTERLKSGVCVLRLNTKLDLSRLSKEDKKLYFSRFFLNNIPDFCHNNKVVQITGSMMELHYDIPCTCTGQIMRK